MKKSHVIAVGISVIALGLLYLATSPPERAAASVVLKPNEASVVASGKQVYAETAHPAMVLPWRGKRIGDSEAAMGTCRHHPMMKRDIPGTI